MPVLQASRRLVKSPPELWAEVSDAASLAKHLGEVGEIRITRLEPETTVAWEGERASGTVELAPAGWGTSVTLTAEPVSEGGAEPEPAAAAAEPAAAAPESAAVVPEPAGPEPEPEPAPEPVTEVPAEAAPSAEAKSIAKAEPIDPEPEPVEREPAPARTPWFVRLFRRKPAAAASVEPAPPPPAEPEPEPAVKPAAVIEPAPVAESRPAAEPEPAADPLEAVLTGALDSLGAAHHRPFSRG